MRFAILAAAFAALSPVARAAFGYTVSGSSYTIDTAAANAFTFTVSSASCDITSLHFYGTEYQYSATASHISSGLGSVSFSITTIGDYIKITCTTSTLTQYLVAHNGDSNIYMATYTTAEPSVGELRFIARLNSALLTTSAYPASYSGLGTAGAVEGSDVYYDSSGYTYSKFYSSVRFIDDQVHWVSTSDASVHVMPGNAYECSSGGPFHRDINTDKTSTSGAHNLYFYMNSGHAQTESFRQGLHGPYALVFSRSGIPDKSLDLSFFSSLSISGYVASSGRGTVKGTATGVSSSYQIVLHWYNSDVQYWVYASSSGAFTSPLMKPGTYTMVLYKNELPVATQTVTVTAGGTTTSNIASSSDPASTTPTWIIGEFDGRPTGFLNAALQERMHPSDVRMSAWGAVTYTVGSSSTSVFPMAQIKAVNNPTTIKFTLTSSQTGAATLRIGSTLAFAGGRPQVTVNSWLGPAPAAPVDLNSRGFTRGTYRGNNVIYEVSIPSGTLVSGTNYVYINVISGSSGDTFLSPNFVYDAVGLWTSGGSTTTTTTTTTSKTTTTT
ncbi:polysaccharide lyase family 4 protein [Tulasnella calospora MUT 4182]|uniref:Rhamnogalacturonate lyase n=1 Tax=Tulasnella calospora MUT 4182 TaxID=1051891 RepID=A0A0C3QMG8_9AGAM|nr:polysaccharide lyase family 4 protein [Tulasnella calospora MUT 4182]